MPSTTPAPDVAWTSHPAAYQLVQQAVAEACAESLFLSQFAAALKTQTGTRLIDWTDRVTTSASDAQLRQLGFVADCESEPHVYRHPQAQLPALWSGYGKKLLAIKCDQVTDFMVAHQLDARCQIAGSAGAAVRRACVDLQHDFELWAVERHGSRNWQTEDVSPSQLERVQYHAERFQLRRRQYDTAAEGFAAARTLMESAMAELGRDRTCDLFFAAERAYWQSRNTAAQVQKMRQDRLGLGWANHDHHTYRCSRAAFASLIAIFELLGLECRERFYAGREAGWGAQVMEQPQAGIIVFADVDLSPDEVQQDFAHEPLPPAAALGTVGLWCALHGEAFLEAGMHHLECQFDFDAAREQLGAAGIAAMKPFTDLPYLRQAFTAGQRWPVPPARLEQALNAGWIDDRQAHAFRTEGAIGSHLEILERHDGYKGFNRSGISEIIAATDPRKQLANPDNR
jgi:hypothetical protein